MLACIAWIVALVFAIVGRTLAVAGLLAPAIVAVAMVLVAVDLPFRGGFELARPTLEAAVASGTSPERAGLFTVSDRVLEDDFSSSEIVDAGFLNGVGYGVVPPGAAAPTVGTTSFVGPVVMALNVGGCYVAVEPR
ncbi:hypothetical protein F8O01_09055 [Pseudoclavibacter chungangensis]|uniref:Uncharacterized protein n=1 Tax=Pseudoclavibacter chungangensis TaxID=587635 RepID=A0A7J5BR62_9MICO|nr:hypothetical protein [Pseudoclavibacter chungangensis]KAB1656798.1 hypothetical protein F8O01_09055 [Pseudoclavibacter chungangensis]NYJ67247.1 hypothetical protein [Pseudoclavibacter chungangensis]